jgi:hypothetical protein
MYPRRHPSVNSRGPIRRTGPPAPALAAGDKLPPYEEPLERLLDQGLLAVRIGQGRPGRTGSQVGPGYLEYRGLHPEHDLL